MALFLFAGAKVMAAADVAKYVASGDILFCHEYVLFCQILCGMQLVCSRLRYCFMALRNSVGVIPKCLRNSRLNVGTLGSPHDSAIALIVYSG